MNDIIDYWKRNEMFYRFHTITQKERLEDLKKAKIEAPNWSFKLKNLNEDNNREKILSGKDSCVDYSFKTWIRLYKIKAKRVRGLINSDYFYNPNNNSNFHYWVETDKYCFNETAEMTTISPIKEFYDFYKISNVEYADNGAFNKYNNILKTTRDNDNRLEHHRLFLEKNKENNKKLI